MRVVVFALYVTYSVFLALDEMIAGVLLVLVAGFFFSWIIYIHLKHLQYSHIPQPPRKSFFFGNAKVVQESVMKGGIYGVYHLNLVREYGDLFCDWLMIKPSVFVADPLILKDVYTDLKRFARGRDLPLGYLDGVRVMGNHSILSDAGGPIWRHKKRVMDPVFSILKLTEHLSKFYAIAADAIVALDEARMKSAEGRIDIREVFKPFVVDAISYAGFNADEKNREILCDSNNGFPELISDVMFGKGRLHRLINPTSRKKTGAARLNMRKIREAGKQLIYQRTNSDDFRVINDILDKVIEANINEDTAELDLENSLDDFVTMYMAGNATTLTTLGWSIAELIRNPKVLDRLVQEVDDVWCAADIDRSTEFIHIGRALKEMTYLEAFVKEVLRKNPPVGFSSKKTNFPEVWKGYYIPKGTFIDTSQYVMHRYDKYWKDPDLFDPDRFLNSSPTPYTYFPFLMGPRQCIGKNFAILELKVILCEMLKTFHFRKPADCPDKPKCFQALLCIPLDEVCLDPRY